MEPAWASTSRPSYATRHRIRGSAPGRPADPPEHLDYPRIIAVFNEATGPLRARDVCEALDHELLPKNIEGTGTKLKRLVKLDVLTEGRHVRLHQEAVAGRVRDEQLRAASPGNGRHGEAGGATPRFTCESGPPTFGHQAPARSPHRRHSGSGYRAGM